MLYTKHIGKAKRLRKVKNKRIDKVVSGNKNIKEAGVAILFPDRVKIRAKFITSGK